MVLFSLTSAVLEISSAVVYFVVDKSVRGIGRLIFSTNEKKIEYDETYLMISEVNIDEKPITDELADVKKELEQIKNLLKNN